MFIHEARQSLFDPGAHELFHPSQSERPTFPAEGYLGIPLFADGKCFAHFGMMWTQEGLDKRENSWGYTEMLLHALEDMITERLLRGQGFANPEHGTLAKLDQLKSSLGCYRHVELNLGNHTPRAFHTNSEHNARRGW